MKTRTAFLALLMMLALSGVAGAQDDKTVESKVTGLLAAMPAGSQEAFNTMMEELISLGSQGLDIICGMITAPGTDDDTAARYAVSGLSYYLAYGDSGKRQLWESTCIRYARQSSNTEVKNYFLEQLALAGSDASVDILASSLADTLLCQTAITSLEAIGTESAAGAIITALESDNFLFAAQAIETLTRMGYTGRTDVFRRWYDAGDDAVKDVALIAMAVSGSDDALPVLDAAARKAMYCPEPTDAVSSLLLYAATIGRNGDIRKAEKVLLSVISNCNTPESSNFKIDALNELALINREKALKVMLKEIDDPDINVRDGIINLALSMEGTEITKKWIARYPRVTNQAKADIIYMLGLRGDNQAVPLVMKAMGETDSGIYCEAVGALALLQGKESVDPLLSWIQTCNDDDGLNAAAEALTTVLDSTNISKVEVSLKGSREYATVMLINILSWWGDTRYFSTVLPFASSGDIAVRATALKALKNLASSGDQPVLIDMVSSSNERPETEALQGALAAAANSNPLEEERSDAILNALEKGYSKTNLIPVLALTGGSKALDYVLKEFENGDAAMRDLCFSTLSGWKDYSATDALYTICVSGNKTFGKAAFDSYIRLVQSAETDDDRKLDMYKKIAPFAYYPDSRAEMIVMAGAIRTIDTFNFVLPYLDDEDDNVKAWAAAALSNIALPHNGEQGLKGEQVRKGLVKALPLIIGPDSESEKEEVKRYLDTMTDGAQPGTARQ